MKLVDKAGGSVVRNSNGEQIREIIAGDGHSFGIATIPHGCKSDEHYHPEAEEVYCILEGDGELYVDGNKIMVSEGDTVLIERNERHYIQNDYHKNLIFVVVCVPAWTLEGSIFV